MTSFKLTLFSIVCFTFSIMNTFGQSGNYQSHLQTKNELLIVSDIDVKLRIQFYSNYVYRISWIKKGEEFFKNDHYEMVETHKYKGGYKIKENEKELILVTGDKKEIQIKIHKSPLGYQILNSTNNKAFIKEGRGVFWNNTKIVSDFLKDQNEHFCGMGHQSFGRVESIDLKDKIVSCNYGEGLNDWGPQAILTVPFYLSSKGYGIFLNSTFEHKFNFGKDNSYWFSIDTKGFEGRMDYFIILGPEFKDILDRYTQLTGRPRLPQKSMFGLQLSDKGDPKHDGANWWKNKISTHRKAGYPFDHIVYDNRWRAGSGAWAESWFEWDSIRTPDPVDFGKWCKENNVTVTLDFNRNNASLCEGWKEEYNIQGADKYLHHYGNSIPDYSNPTTRKWVWELFWNKSFNPKLNYPGDALWIDETDEMYVLNDSLICHNGRSWAENENYYPFLIAKAIVQEGWDNKNNSLTPGIGEAKRPFVWVRSMSAGAQRYATQWTGDIKSDWNWMKTTIRSLQTAGLAGFPYYNHDAGGFRPPGPDDSFYIQWAMAFSSFTPIWRPHGMGERKRWPLDRSEASQKAAMKYGKLRYEMMPYIYKYAHEAHKTGVPMARAMVIDHSEKAEAWKYDLQYMWGNELLVAPNYSAGDTTLNIWLPDNHNWYYYWNDQKLKGDQVIQHNSQFGETPLFVKEGAIIPFAKYTQSTATIDPSLLILHIYIGANGEFKYYEDDGVTEKFRTKNEHRITKIEFNNEAQKLIIYPSAGDFKGAISYRQYKIVFHGLENDTNVKLNNKKLKSFSEETIQKEVQGKLWNEENKTLIVFVSETDVSKKVILKF